MGGGAFLVVSKICTGVRVHHKTVSVEEPVGMGIVSFIINVGRVGV